MTREILISILMSSLTVKIIPLWCSEVLPSFHLTLPHFKNNTLYMRFEPVKRSLGHLSWTTKHNRKQLPWTIAQYHGGQSTSTVNTWKSLLCRLFTPIHYCVICSHAHQSEVSLKHHTRLYCVAYGLRRMQISGHLSSSKPESPMTQHIKG